MILVFDCPVERNPGRGRGCSPGCLFERFAVRLIGYDERQHRIARRISWGWVYGWMSWCLAIRHARTRAVIIHDLDAMPLEAEFFERALRTIETQDRPEFCGIGKYTG